MAIKKPGESTLLSPAVQVACVVGAGPGALEAPVVRRESRRGGDRETGVGQACSQPLQTFFDQQIISSISNSPGDRIIVAGLPNGFANCR